MRELGKMNGNDTILESGCFGMRHLKNRCLAYFVCLAKASLSQLEMMGKMATSPASEGRMLRNDIKNYDV